MAENLLVVLSASRPAGWCFGPILFGIGLIHSRSIPKSRTMLTKAGFQVISLSFPLCIVVFGINDIYDYESDIINPRKLASSLEGGVIPPVYHPILRVVAHVSTLFILCISLMTLNLQNVLSTALLVFLGWQYSAPPFRLKEIPVVDSLTNGAIVFLTWFVGYSFGRGRLQELPDKGVILSFCAAGTHALGAAVDVESDIASGQTTIATAFGRRTAAIFGVASL
ncbi:UbiA prenyltransferase family [Hysterangium stoloniferum]|nr:UbiA prenyltransferase family [Hysterangium stoloniferum]